MGAGLQCVTGERVADTNPTPLQKLNRRQAAVKPQTVAAFAFQASDASSKWLEGEEHGNSLSATKKSISPGPAWAGSE